MWLPSLQYVLLVTEIFWIGTDAAFAAMSVDLGSQFLKVGIIKPGVPMEIVLNRETRRKTPNVISIRQNERIFGDAALAVATKYPQNVYGNLLDLVAKNFDHPSVRLYRQRFPLHVLKQSPKDSGVDLLFGETSLNVEVVIAMLLSHAKDITEEFAEQPVKDIVITVPHYFNQAERLAIENAAKIAKLNVLQLLNEGTAVGLNYGAFQRKQITETPTRMLIFDMGSAKTAATIVEYQLVKSKTGTNPKMSVLGVGYDRALGGLEATLRLRTLLLQKFAAAHKLNKDIATVTRAMAKLFKEAERVKHVLSANVEHFAQVESLHEDIDMREKITRPEFEHLLTDFDDRITAVVEQALKMSGRTIDEIDQVVLMGAATRVPLVQTLLQKAVHGKDLGRFINTDEAAAMGALFQAAHLSKGFKVKPFDVEDIVTLPVEVKFTSKVKEENGEVTEKEVTRELFTYKSIFPSKKKTLSFTSFFNDFSFKLGYGNATHLTEGQILELQGMYPGLADVSITGLTEAVNSKVIPGVTELKSVKVAFLMDASGIVRIGNTEIVIESLQKGIVSSLTDKISEFFTKTPEEGEPIADTDDKEKGFSEEDAASTKAKPVKQETPQTKTDASKEANAEDKIKTKEYKQAETTAKSEADTTIPDVQTIILKHSENYIGATVLTLENISAGRKMLDDYARSEKQAAERGAAVNELESLAFESSLLVDEQEFIRYSTEEERTMLTTETTRIRTWLEDEITPETPLDEFKQNLLTIKDIVNPVKKRISEAETRGKSLNTLEETLKSSKSLLKMGGDGETSLFRKNDTEAFGKKLDKLTLWIKDKKEAQSAKAENEDPVLLTRELQGKIKALDRELQNFMKKMNSARIKDIKQEDLADAMDDLNKKGSTTPEKESLKPAKAESKEATGEPPSDKPAGKIDSKIEL